MVDGLAEYEEIAGVVRRVVDRVVVGVLRRVVVVDRFVVVVFSVVDDDCFTIVTGRTVVLGFFDGFGVASHFAVNGQSQSFPREFQCKPLGHSCFRSSP